MTMIPPFRGLDFKADDDDELIGRSQKGSRVLFFRLQKRRALLSIDDLLRFGERSVGGGGGSLTRRKKDRFARRCDDAFCWNAPNNKLSFLFFFLPRRIFIGAQRKKERKSSWFWSPTLANYFLDRRRLKRERKCKAPKIH